MHDKLFALPVIKQLSAYISQRQLGELPLIIVSHPKVRGAVSIQGAQLIDWQPCGQKPCIWLSSESAFKAGTAIRGVSLFAGLGLAPRVAQVMVSPAFYRGNLLHIMNMKMA